MPRFVWVLVFLWCTALAQVQPVEPLLPHPDKECCCDCGGTCGMPGCALAPAPAQTPAEPAGTLTVARPAVTVSKLPLALTTEKFFALFLAPAAPCAANASPPLPESAAPSASAPLFQQHCSLLI